MKKIYQNIICAVLAGAMAIFPTGSALAMQQDETVYTKLQSDGSVKQVSVTRHLINDAKENQLFDESILNDIENLNGFETFEKNEQRVIWAANGNDIYYTGTADRELPIKVEMSYSLDGENKTVEEMVGKSGHVEMHWKFTNLSRVGDLYTPFVVALGTTLNEAQNTNAAVSSGKVASNGQKIAVSAVAAPGLYESLKLDELKGCDEIILSYDTEKFELGDIYMIVTPKLLESADLQFLTKLDDLYNKTTVLSSSSKQLVAGTDELYQGLNEFKQAILVAKQKFQVSDSMLAELNIEQLKAQARTAAEQKVEAQSASIRAAIKAQVENNPTLIGALELQAAEMCQQKLGQDCPETAISTYKAQLVSGVEEEMFQSSLALAKTTAGETAEETVAQSANTFIGVVKDKLPNILNSSLYSMVAGVDKLIAGANELRNGMTTFDTAGIQPLVDFVNGKLRTTSDNVKRLSQLAEEYNNFAGISEDATGETKFILMIEGKKED